MFCSFSSMAISFGDWISTYLWKIFLMTSASAKFTTSFLSLTSYLGNLTLELRRPGGFATAFGRVRRSGQKKRERRKNAGGSFSPTPRTSVYQSLPHFSKFRAVEPFQPPGGGDVTFFRCDRSLPLFLRQRRRPGG